MAINYKFNWKTLIILILVIILAMSGYLYYAWVNRVIPEELLPQAIEKTTSVDSYRYHVALELNVNDQDRLLSKVKGERQGEEFQLEGEIAGQEVDVIYVENKVYMRDSVSGRWMVNHGGDIFQQDLFMIEVNPIASLEYETLNNIYYLGVEKDSVTAVVIEYSPVVTNKMLTTYWNDFKYKVWIDRRTKRVFKAEIFANHKDNPQNGLHMQLVLYDFNKNVKIEAPSTE
ncbi:MAG: hypothetical protein APF76_05850 [Desulfitibacter sp. BRH_c19]|nr:MAG: hypothetical protein APF76_05850 [Desulfitibacter sp. BRH_c19]